MRMRDTPTVEVAMLMAAPPLRVWELITDRQTTMLGTDDMVRQRMRVWRDAGITTLRLYPAGQTLDERLTTLGRAVDIVEALNREPH